MIVLDLGDVTRVDAAGVAELVRAFNVTAAVNGRLRITNASPWVQEMSGGGARRLHGIALGG
jgi:anti-anti-sigma regulatory factor